jgi:PAS domain S-box-containing protein
LEAALRLGRFVAVGLLSCTVIEALHATRRRVEANVRAWPEDEGRYHRLVEGAGGGVWVVDRGGRTTYANRHLGVILGVPPRDLVGRRWQEFLVNPDPRLDRWATDPTLDLGSREVRLRRSDGEHRAVVVSACPIALDDDPTGRAGRTGELLLTVTDVTDITPLMHAEDALRVERHLKSAVLETIGCLVVVLDPKGEILRLNRACRQMIGHNAEGAVGRAFWDVFLPPEEVAGDRALFERLVAGGPTLDTSRWRIRNGHDRHIAWSNATLVSPSGGVEYVIATGIDVTELKEVEEALREAKERAEAASQAKDRFLAVLSHELRTPLTPVLIAVSSMLENSLDSSLLADLEMIQRNVLLEARLIDDLLDVALINRGRFRLVPEVVDFHEAIRCGIAICRGEAQEAGMGVETVLDAAHHHVLADRARIMQIIWNLIRNAVKFSGPGEGTLTIRTINPPGPGEGESVGDAPRPRLVVEFADTGIGIDPVVMPQIFEPFKQGQAGLRGRFSGLGLGLSIFRSSAEAHGGTLSATSPGPGRGSTFRLELEAVPTPVAVAGASPETPVDAPGPALLRVLLVEDNKDILLYLADGLRRHGHEVVAINSLAAARAAASEAAPPFDLLVSDIELPDGSGLDLMRDLGGGLVPGLAISGYGSEEDVRQCLEAGFSEHLTKPLDTDRLIAAIHRVMVKAGNRAEGICINRNY